MEANDLKNRWKSEACNNIAPYSDNELKKMVLKSARKSIKRNYPSVVFMLLIVASFVLLVINIAIKDTSTAMRLLDIGMMIVLVVSLTLWAQSFNQIRQYKVDIPIKKWLEYRIKEIEKSLRFYTKYNSAICLLASALALGYYFLSIYLNSFVVSPWVVGGVAIGICVFIFLAQKRVVKNYHKTLNELKELDKQLTNDDYEK